MPFLTKSLTLLVLWALGSFSSFAQEAPTAFEADRQARQLFRQAMDLMEMRQHDRGLAMLASVVRDHQGTLIAHQAHLEMGRHHLQQHNNEEALGHFNLLTRLLAPVPGEETTPEERELYLEALFSAGLAHYQAGQYNACFPLFRRLTEVADRTPWANKAWFYIGMSHYNLQNWNKAIDALSLVGTVMSEDESENSDDLGRIEIGQRFYSKISDADIPVKNRLGIPVTVTVESSSGDKETITAAPIPGKDTEMLASIPTTLGEPTPGDGTLQLLGGDTVTVTYIDQATESGQANVTRTGKVRAVSTGSVGFYLGDLTTPAYIAYPGQPVVVILRDADLDTSPAAETITLTVRSRYKTEADTAADAEDPDIDDLLGIFAAEDTDRERWEERDSIRVTLTEQGSGDQIRSGVFVGTINLAQATPGAPNDSNTLACAELDQLIVEYTDLVHLHGDDPRKAEATIQVAGSVSSGVTADQFVVFDELIKARKGIVEAEALVGLGGIYKDMGLTSRAADHARESLEKVDEIILNRTRLPGDIVENAFRLKWESELLRDDFTAATAACLAFNRLFPESVLADQALMTLGRSLTEQAEFDRAVEVFQKVLALENPISAAEAQFRIGNALQSKAERDVAAEGTHGSRWTAQGLSPASALQARMAPAIAAYRRTYEIYPESPYAADALGRVVRHHVETENFRTAADLLESVFADYPDASFLDEMLLLWANVAFRMNDNATARAKLQQLIFNYPTSPHVTEARSRLAALGEE
ncbi:MAG: tetratricopeptide repeat protein [Luteolibacter sp.]